MHGTFSIAWRIQTKRASQVGEGKGLFHRRYTQEHACPIREEEKKDPRGVTSPFPSPTRQQNRRNFSAMTPLPPSPPLTTAIKTLFLGRDHNFFSYGSCAKNPPPLVFFSKRRGCFLLPLDSCEFAAARLLCFYHENAKMEKEKGFSFS